MARQEVLTGSADNAALLYYQAFLLTTMQQPDEAMIKILSEIAAGRIQPTDQARDFLDRHRSAIDLLLQAAQIPDCNWGIDHSTWPALPHIARRLLPMRIVLADAQILADKGDFKDALKRCIAVIRMGHHISTGGSVCCVSGMGVIETANKSLQVILGKMPPDADVLEWLKDELAKTEDWRFPFRRSVEIELGATGAYINRQQAQNALGPNFGEWARDRLAQEVAEFAIRCPDEFFARNEKYWNDYASAVSGALDYDYAEAIGAFGRLEEKTKHDKDTIDGVLTGFFAAYISGMLNHYTRTITFSNAIAAAVEVYIDKAQTGKLPDRLSAGLPNDMFSGEDFEYEKSDCGFTLRCRGRDLLADKLHLYEFVVA